MQILKDIWFYHTGIKIVDNLYHSFKGSFIIFILAWIFTNFTVAMLLGFVAFIGCMVLLSRMDGGGENFAEELQRFKIEGKDHLVESIEQLAKSKKMSKYFGDEVQGNINAYRKPEHEKFHIYEYKIKYLALMELEVDERDKATRVLDAQLDSNEDHKEHLKPLSVKLTNNYIHVVMFNNNHAPTLDYVMDNLEDDDDFNTTAPVGTI